jgi:multidrug efflux pump subunit AcrA (membrane-fusion protein)
VNQVVNGLDAQSRLRAASAPDEMRVLSAEMPRFAIRALAGFIIATVLIAAGVAVLMPFPVSVSAPFVLVPEEGADPVDAPVGGLVEEIHVVGGERVRAGDALFVLSSHEVAERAARERGLSDQLEEHAQLDRVLEARHRTALEAAEHATQSYASEAAIEAERAQITRRMSERGRKLLDVGVISEARVDSLLLAYQEVRVAGERAARQAREAKAEVRRIAAERQKELSERAIERGAREAELAQVRAWLAQSGGSGDTGRVVVTAPFDGIVASVGPRRADTVIERGTVLCQLAREGTSLRAELSVPENDAGLLSPGQSIKLLLNSYPYTKYGTRSAVVRWVSPIAENGTLRAIAQLGQQSLVVDGVERAFQPGMQGEARVSLGSQTLWQLAMEPLRRLRESVSEPARLEVSSL